MPQEYIAQRELAVEVSLDPTGLLNIDSCVHYLATINNASRLLQQILYEHELLSVLHKHRATMSWFDFAKYCLVPSLQAADTIASRIQQAGQMRPGTQDLIASRHIVTAHFYAKCLGVLEQQGVPPTPSELMQIAKYNLPIQSIIDAEVEIMRSSHAFDSYPKLFVYALARIVQINCTLVSIENRGQTLNMLELYSIENPDDLTKPEPFSPFLCNLLLLGVRNYLRTTDPTELRTHDCVTKALETVKWLITLETTKFKQELLLLFIEHN